MIVTGLTSTQANAIPRCLQVETGTDFVTDSVMSKGSVKWDSSGIGRIQGRLHDGMRD
jgi:hypothetical protein